MKFKDYYNKDCAKLLSQKIKVLLPKFNSQDFIKYIDKNVADKELFERLDVFVVAFELYLGNNYEQNIRIFENILGPELAQETGMFSEGWWLWSVGRYVEKHGLENKGVRIALPWSKIDFMKFNYEQ